MTDVFFDKETGEILGYKELSRIKLEKDETLVMVVPKGYTAEELKRASTILGDRLPPGVKYLVVTENVHFTTIKAPPP